MSNATGAAITINGKQHDLSTLSEEARSQITNLRVVDQRIAEAQQTLAILQTARSAYARALKAALPAEEQRNEGHSNSWD